MSPDSVHLRGSVSFVWMVYEMANRCPHLGRDQVAKGPFILAEIRSWTVTTCVGAGTGILVEIVRSPGFGRH